MHDHQYGFDPILEYIDIYVPKVAQGMNIRAGRFISIPGIEAQLTPNNYMFSHSLLYAIDPFTDTGILATVQLSDQWLVQAGITGSHDVALWTDDARPSATACVSYTTPRSTTISISAPMASTMASMPITTSAIRWHLVSQILQDLAYGDRGLRDVSARRAQRLRSIKPQPNTDGATCRPGLETCFAPEYAAVNYILKQLSDHDFIGFRSDLLNDKKGQRTGVNTKYTENTLC